MNNEVQTGVMATAYMPPLAFWVAARRGIKVSGVPGDGVLRLCGNEHYRKQTYRNRAVILSAQGEQRLTVPVSCQKGPYTKTDEVLLCYHQNWPRDHWRSLCTAYNNSPYFLYYRDELEAILLQDRFEKLWDLNERLMAFFIKAFGLGWTIERVKCGARDGGRGGAQTDVKCGLAPKPGDVSGSAHRHVANSGVIAFSDKAPELFSRFAPTVREADYQTTFMQPPPCVARLSSCDVLFNYGPQAATLLI